MPDFDFDAFNRREFQQDSNNNYNESSAPAEPKPEAAPEERPMPDNPPAPDVPPAEEDLKW